LYETIHANESLEEDKGAERDMNIERECHMIVYDVGIPTSSGNGSVDRINGMVRSCEQQS